MERRRGDSAGRKIHVLALFHEARVSVRGDTEVKSGRTMSRPHFGNSSTNTVAKHGPAHAHSKAAPASLERRRSRRKLILRDETQSQEALVQACGPRPIDSAALSIGRKNCTVLFVFLRRYDTRAMTGTDSAGAPAPAPVSARDNRVRLKALLLKENVAKRPIKTARLSSRQPKTKDPRRARNSLRPPITRHAPKSSEIGDAPAARAGG
ncbi:hypothetical protein EVAR_10205_1 [Eumeta japonica]|uniref:Uncharacterized protein n=1 Tax=Eumeta variegata TaxID=151549 RepID=A0A4C1TDJ3_EUMVA|nr:hypothetical protein EVAR_10205_1 [Eumeta japonica]